jgi:hypothetical protein
MTRTSEEDRTRIALPNGTLADSTDVQQTGEPSIESSPRGGKSPFQKATSPLKLLIRPLLVAALGLHALILFTPFPTPKKPLPKETEAPVKITQLPSSKPTPKPRPKIKKVVAKVNRPRTTPPAPKTSPPPADNSTDSTKDPFQDFPHHPQAQAGCYNKESCYEVKGAALDTVANFFKKALPDKKFSLTPLIEEPGKAVFQVTKGDKSLFLNIFQDGKNSVYALAPNEIPSLSAFKGAIEVPSALYELFSSLPDPPSADPSDPAATATIATPDDFEQPQLFFKTTGDDASGFADTPELLSGIDGSPKIAIGEEPEIFFQTFFEQELNNIFDEVTPDGEYGGGPLYRLKKGTSTFYLNLVPQKRSQTGVATIIVLWTRSPK